MKTKFYTRIFLLLIVVCNISGTYNGNTDKKKLTINFHDDAKIEIGNFYAGLEFHHSYPVPQRFSFYYPVANSIDLSTDYWRRDTTFAMTVGFKFGDSEIEWLNAYQYEFDLTPFSVDFFKEDDKKKIELSYAFTKNKPAVVISYTITNKTNETQEVELYTKYALAFRTSHTYRFSNKINSVISNNGESVFVNHNDYEVGNAAIFIVNGSELPFDIQINDNENNVEDFFQKHFPLKRLVDNPSANFIYKKQIAPDEKLLVNQIIGTCKPYEVVRFAEYLKSNYEKEIDEFENSILEKIEKSITFNTGDKLLDHSILWSKAILEVNKHYIDGEIMPMPCPAEYNFYFTHDVLLTDLAAINFDLDRVKNDLYFIVKHANKDKIIPHAYYWKDSSFVTELAEHDNWNNFWFIIVSSEYLKHSGDKKFSEEIFPYVEKSLTQALITKGDDNLMWSYRPDWWDIGKRYGQRSYMTILAIKAIRSFLFISSVLEKGDQKLYELEQLSERMEKNLNEKLWRDDYGYLMNCTDPDKIDEHYYSGSLLAAHYGLLDESKVLKMINTAEQKIVDKKIGVYTAYPMDFDELQDYWHFVSNEAGDKFYYLNGGIWQHSNAWYALALISSGNKVDAAQFIKEVMTVDGIMNGPNGQPAMYEVRNGNINNPEVYGTIDKPQFMWAGGWYLYSLYYLFGLNNNEWNIEFDPFLLEDQQSCSFCLTVNNKIVNTVIAKEEFQNIKIDGTKINSLIIPREMKNITDIKLTIGKLSEPFVKTSNSILESCLFSEKTNEMKIKLGAFTNHSNKTIIVSKQKPNKVLLNGKILENVSAKSIDGGYKIEINFIHKNVIELLEIKF